MKEGRDIDDSIKDMKDGMDYKATVSFLGSWSLSYPDLHLCVDGSNALVRCSDDQKSIGAAPLWSGRFRLRA